MPQRKREHSDLGQGGRREQGERRGQITHRKHKENGVQTRADTASADLERKRIAAGRTLCERGGNGPAAAEAAGVGLARETTSGSKNAACFRLGVPAVLLTQVLPLLPTTGLMDIIKTKGVMDLGEGKEAAMEHVRSIFLAGRASDEDITGALPLACTK